MLGRWGCLVTLIISQRVPRGIQPRYLQQQPLHCCTVYWLFFLPRVMFSTPVLELPGVAPHPHINCLHPSPCLRGNQTKTSLGCMVVSFPLLLHFAALQTLSHNWAKSVGSQGEQGGHSKKTTKESPPAGGSQGGGDTHPMVSSVACEWLRRCQLACSLDTRVSFHLGHSPLFPCPWDYDGGRRRVNFLLSGWNMKGRALVCIQVPTQPV